MSEDARRLQYGYTFRDKSDVVIQQGIFNGLPDELRELGRHQEYAIVTDTNVMDKYAVPLLDALRANGMSVSEPIEIPAGEASKTPEQFVNIANQLAERRHGRNTTIIAVGGGMVGDITGFTASVYKRGVGISYVQVPTTLLAQVDSSIGGKTGINLDSGKNLIGRVEFPRATFIDPKTLTTLPSREVISGIGEIVKYAVLDGELLTKLELSMDDLLRLDMSTLFDIISSCAEIKSGVVDLDPNDIGIRQALNIGHTIGHGLEEASGYKLSHGEAISIGMMREGEIAVAEGFFKRSELKRLEKILIKAGLPTQIPGDIDINEVMRLMTNDKKNTGPSSFAIALPGEFGTLSKGYELLTVPHDQMREFIS